MDLEKYYKDTENKGIDEFWALSDDKKKEILSEKEEFERLEPYYLLFEALTQYISTIHNLSTSKITHKISS